MTESLSAFDEEDVDAVEAAPTDAGVDSLVEGLLISPRSLAGVDSLESCDEDGNLGPDAASSNFSMMSNVVTVNSPIKRLPLALLAAAMPSLYDVGGKVASPGSKRSSRLLPRLNSTCLRPFSAESAISSFNAQKDNRRAEDEAAEECGGGDGEEEDDVDSALCWKKYRRLVKFHLRL